VIRTKTAFVVGAGASVDFGFPLGAQLTPTIATTLGIQSFSSEDAERELILLALNVLCERERHRDEKDLISKAMDMAAGLVTADSIDTYIHNFSHDPDIALLGKLAIATCLLLAENKSSLRSHKPGETIDLSQLSTSWLGRLFPIMASEVSARSVERMFENVSFVVFNYDRCIEFYFEHAIASRFRMPLSEARSFVASHLNIVHPYGALGKMIGPDRIEFGQRLEPATVSSANAMLRMAQSLRTFTESVTGSERNQITRTISTAKRLVFLGFGFQHQNVQLLKCEKSEVRAVRATTIGMSNNACWEVLNRIKTITANPHLGDHENLLNVTCPALVSDERLFLEG
jgi:hypothetical protein